MNIQEIPLPGTTTEDTIYYSPDRKLTWNDFKGNVRQASPSAAISFSGFSYDAVSKNTRDTIFVTLYLQVYFDGAGSWVREGSKTAYALSHEQLHFDIARLAAAAFKDSVLRRNFTPDYYASEIHLLYWDYWRYMTREQTAFDDETNHGINRAAEMRWADKIRRALLSDSNQGSPRDE